MQLTALLFVRVGRPFWLVACWCLRSLNPLKPWLGRFHKGLRDLGLLAGGACLGGLANGNLSMFVIVVLIVAVLAIGGSLVGDGVKSAQPSDEPTNREIMDAVQKLDAKVEQVGLPSSSGVGVDSSSVGAPGAAGAHGVANVTLRRGGSGD